MAGDARAGADHHPRADGDEGADGGALADHRRGVDGRQRVDAGGNGDAGIKVPREAGHGIARPPGQDRGLQPQPLPVGIGPEDGRPRPALRQPGGIFRVHGNGQILRPGLGRLGGATDGQAGVAGHGGADGVGNLAQGMGHGLARGPSALGPERPGVRPDPYP